MTSLQEGQKAADFTALDENGNTVRLADFTGKKLVIFFYPKDNTPTCTVEACNLRDNYADLKSRGYEVLGVSPDSQKRHQNFIGKHELPYTLISDPDLTMINAYNVWGPKKFMGKEYDGLHRTTFIIDEKGYIERIIRKVKSKVHTEQILG